MYLVQSRSVFLILLVAQICNFIFLFYKIIFMNRCLKNIRMEKNDEDISVK
jgi:hypothetical protein